jgi:glutaredoxin
MEIPEPKLNEFTIYSKSGCINCNNVKKLLKDNERTFTVINCDEFLLEDKDVFLQFICKLAGKEYKIFPMVFNGTKFIGGFNETSNYIDKLLDFDLSF